MKTFLPFGLKKHISRFADGDGDGFIDDVIEPAVGGGGGEGDKSHEESEKPEKWKAALAELTDNVAKLATPPKAAAAPETPEQIAEKWAIFNPEKSDPDFFVKWLRLQKDMDPAEKTAALKEYRSLWDQMQNGLVKQSVVGARNLFMKELETRDARLAEMENYVASVRARETRSRFETAYPDLSGQQFTKVLRLAAGELAQKTFTSEDDYFKALAESAAEFVKTVNPAFALGAGQTRKAGATTPRLPRTSVGGTGGNSRAGQTSAASDNGGASRDDTNAIDW